VKCLLDGLDSAPSDPVHRAAAEALLAAEGLAALQAATQALDPAQYARLRDPENPRRVVRAYELLAAGHPLPSAENAPVPKSPACACRPMSCARASTAAPARCSPADWSTKSAPCGLVPGSLRTARHAIGYKEAGRVLDGEISEEQAIHLTAVRTAQYSKRQMTWFRHQADVTWVDAGPAR
jgi:tRNA dimethylallyltransferase